ncbi:MAG TPA: protease pro-enzyme activation domain-containing protein [Acidobacteriaceae bacterium]|nr:protease pro-enzyme activation domain-containing protein [Acidobacteriaceae bacterium]
MKTSLLRLIVLTAATVCVSLPLTAQSTYAINRVVAPIDETNLVTLRGNVHPMAQARYDRGPAPEATPTGRIMLLLERSASQQQALTQYLADLQNPSSPNYHKWLTPAQYGALYGISDADLQTVEGWLQGHGFKIEKVPQGRNVIEFSGTFGQLQSAFHTSMHSLVVNGQNHFANMTNPQIPAALAPVIAGVGPLNDFRPKPPIVTGSRGHWDASTKHIVPDLTLQTQSGQDILFVDPADASTIYDTPNINLNGNFATGTTSSYDGTGVNLGIVGESDLNLDDVTNYRTGFLDEDTGTANIPTVIVAGNDPGLVSGWAVEALLDNEVAGGLAPKAKIYFYTEADTDLTSGFVDAAFRALDDNTVSILSMSIEECEAGLGSSGNLQVYEGEQQAAAQGITVVVAAGDNGSAGCDDFDTGTSAVFGFNVNGFASTPYAVAVGGTDYDTLAASFSTYVNDTTSGSAPYYQTALKYIPENPWNQSTTVNTAIADNVATESDGETNIVAGSGGFSSCATQDAEGDCIGGYPVPPFQASVTPSGGVTNSNQVRMIPDVAFMAGAGQYDATWVVCSDPASDGSTESYTECANTNHVFSSDTYFDGVGGTSAAAPAFAGMLALVAQAEGSSSDNYRLGAVDPVLYSLAANATTYASVFHDITVGDNAVVCTSGTYNCGTNGFMQGYNAGTNYDLTSGLGSVDVTALVKNWGNVKFGSTTTTLNIGGSTAAYTGTHGATLTFNVGVTPTTATGNAAIIDNADETTGGTADGLQNNGQIAVPLTSGAGSVQYNGLPGGQYTVYARYGGDDANAASKSAGISVNISAEASTTALQVNAYNPQTENQLGSLTSIPYGSIVLLDAEIEGTAEGTNTQGSATGKVTFASGTTTLGTANVDVENVASYPPLSSSFVAFAPGSYNLVASYSGDASFKASNSTAVPFTVAKAATSTAASANPTTVSSGGSTTVTVTVTTPANDGANPTGNVTLALGSTTLATISSFTSSYVTAGQTIDLVLTGSATVQASALAAGSNTINVTYTGDGNYATSTTSVIVTGPSTAGISLANSGNISVAAGSSGTSILTVTPANGFTGAVNFACSVSGSPAGLTCSAPNASISGTTAATSTLTVATTSSTPAGSYTATVKASDAATGKITSSTMLTVTVTTGSSGNPTIALTSSGNISVNAGNSGTSTITVTPGGGFTGAVAFACSVSSSPAGLTCSAPSATISGTTAATSTLTVATTSSTPAGSYTATVTASDTATGKITASTTLTVTVTTGNPAIALTSSGNISVDAGNTGTATITVTPSGGFTGAVNLTCAVTTSITNPNDPPSCAITSPVTISGTTAETATLTIGTTQTTGGSATAVPPLGKYFLGGGATLALLFFFGMPARRRAWRSVLSVMTILFVAGAIGCGSSGTKTVQGTTPGIYTATVTGTDQATGKITANVAVTVTVTQLAP